MEMDDLDISVIAEMMAEAGDPGEGDRRVVKLTSVLLNRVELDTFVVGARMRFGDPTRVVGSVFIEYRDDFKGPQDLKAGWDQAHERILLEFFDAGSAPHVMSVPVSKEGAAIGPSGTESFHIRKVTRGVWALAPSLNIPGELHAFITLYNVPDPAPWESLIVVVRG